MEVSLFDFPSLAFEVSFPCVLRSTIMELLIQIKKERLSFGSKTRKKIPRYVRP